MSLKWLGDPRHEDLREALIADDSLWLVTGAAGFIGSNLVEALLLLGKKVRGLDNFATGRLANFEDVRRRVGEQWERFELVEGDIGNLDTCRHAVDGAGIVLHQAALGSVPRSVDDPVGSFQSNVTGFLNLFEACRLGGSPRIVYASSSSVYGDEAGLPKREDRIGRPLSPYAATKYVDEVIADVFCRTYGMGSVGLRYFNVFGPRQDPDGPYAAVIPKWVAQMLADEPVEIFGDGETSRDFCFIDNVVQANLRAALVNVDGSHRVYNVALGGRSTLDELFTAIRLGLDRMGHSYARDPRYRDFREGDVRHSQADVANIARDIGYVPQVGLAEGMTQALEYYVASARDKAR